MRRLMYNKLQELFKKFPIVYLTGPRQSGKTTLAKMAFPDLPYVNFEDISIREAVRLDPHGFLKSYDTGLIIDEVQNVPEIFSYIQLYADQRNIPGQYLLTGSQNFLLNEKISQSLDERVEILRLLPLSYSEVIKNHEVSIDDFIFKGSYPRLYEQNINTEDFFSEYLQTYVERDVRQLKNISSLSTFQKLLFLCAGRVGQILNLSSLSNDCGMSVSTLKEWISVLESSYIVYTLHPWPLKINKQMTKSPKIYFYDTGLLCYLLNIRKTDELKQHFAYGSIFENFVINEIIKLYWKKEKIEQVYFLRDSRGHEIDCVLPFNSPNVAIHLFKGHEIDCVLPFNSPSEIYSEIYYYEIKSGETFSPDFVKNIDYYKDYGKGAVIYRGDNSFTFKDTRIIKLEEFLSSMWDIYNQNELSEIEKRLLEEIRTNNSEKVEEKVKEKVEEEVARRERQREREEIINWLDGNLARMIKKAEARDRLKNWSENVGKPAFDKIWTDLGKDGTPSSERICKVLNDSIVPSLNAANGGSTFRAKYADYKNGIIALTDDSGYDAVYSVFENNPNLKKNHVMTESANAVQETAVSESRKPI